MCDAYLNGTLVANLRKQAAPADGLTRAVKQLVYDTFADVVFDNAKDVLVVFCHVSSAACARGHMRHATLITTCSLLRMRARCWIAYCRWSLQHSPIAYVCAVRARV
jgi:hypothetical protein